MRESVRLSSKRLNAARPHRRRPADQTELYLAQYEAEQRFRAIFDKTSDGIFLHDLETRKLTMCNKSCLQMLGYTEEEFLKLTVADLHPEEDLPFINAQIEKFLQGGTPSRHDIRFKRKDGSIVFADVSPDLVLLDGKRYVVVALKDITERKRMEEELRRHTEHLEELVAARTGALRESEKRYRSLVENDPDIIQRFDRDLRRLYVNPAFEPATGVPAQAALGKTDRELELPEHLIPFWEEAVRTIFRTGERRIIGFEMPTPHGPRHYEAHLVPEFAPDGSTEHVLAITRDITEHVRMEEELRESEERYRSLYHTIADGVFVMGADERIEDVNDSACTQLGYTREELIGMPVAAISARPDFNLGKILDRLRTAGSLSYETTHRRKDGAIIPVELSIASVEYRGRPAVLGVARDISERKRAQESLQFTQFAVDHTADAAFWMTEDARFFYVNEAACRALGYSRDELLEMTVYDIDPAFTENRWRESWRKLKAEKSIVLETVHRARDGRIYPVEIRANYLEFGGREYDCAFARDITERKRAQETMRRLNEQLELQVAQRTEDLRHTVGRLQQLTLELSQAEDRERNRIADILHDDLQQTLVAARFHLNLLSSEPRSAEESQEIIGQVKQMLKDAIEKSRSLSHELSPALYQVGLTDILSWLACHMQRKHGLTVHVEAHGSVDSSSEPLKALLYKVAQELLFNVVKHADVTEARIRVRRMGKRICLSVVDRGCGCDAQGLQGATGFGLLSIRERVQLLGGQMKIRSRRGVGTRVLIAVPDEAPSQVTAPTERRDG